MTRNLKALGLALVAAFAMSAVAASGAFAATHHFDKVGEISAHATPETVQLFKPTTNGESKFECTEVSVSEAKVYTVVEGKTVESETGTEVTGEPHYEGCTATTSEKTVNASVKPNGCHYTFTGETTKGDETETPGEHANVDITCPEEKTIEIRVTALNLKCASISPQTIKHAVSYEEDEADKEHSSIVYATAHGFMSTTYGGTANCSGTGVETTHEDGLYTGEVTVENVRLT